MADASMKELLARSTLAFTGEVDKANESEVPELPADERTVVVTVSEVLNAPPDAGLAAGMRVTVQLSSDLPELQQGDAATFFADALIYGEELAVAEVGRLSHEESFAPSGQFAGLMDEGVEPVEAALAELAQDELVEHARGADVIVRAQVIALAKVPTSGPPREHDPQYWVATLHADFRAKGELPGWTEEGAEVQVLYANSLDVRWRACPKPKAGQGGMWMLHRTSGGEAALAPFELRHAIDLQDSIQIDLLREHGI
jgi:hypothetical protein